MPAPHERSADHQQRPPGALQCTGIQWKTYSEVSIGASDGSSRFCQPWPTKDELARFATKEDMLAEGVRTRGALRCGRPAVGVANPHAGGRLDVARQAVRGFPKRDPHQLRDRRPPAASTRSAGRGGRRAAQFVVPGTTACAPACGVPTSEARARRQKVTDRAAPVAAGRYGAAVAAVPVRQARAQQDREDDRIDQRLADVDLDQPQEVHDAGDGARVDEAVQRRPALAEPPDPALRRSDRQRDHQHEADESGRDVLPLGRRRR